MVTKPLKPLTVRGKPLDHPEFQTYCLLHRDRLWSVLTLDVRGDKIIKTEMTEGDKWEITTRKLIGRITAGIREAEKQREKRRLKA